MEYTIEQSVYEGVLPLHSLIHFDYRHGLVMGHIQRYRLYTTDDTIH